jgi:carbon monoxide dehydrogenase subunit G
VIVSRQVGTRADQEKVFDYLSDFTTTTQWDPATVETVLVSGDGGVGTVYRNRTSFMGRTTELDYVVTELEAPRVITLRGENAALVATDTITVEPAGPGSDVTYRADFAFKGAWRLVEPLMRPALRRLGDRAEAGLRTTLAGL